MTTSEAINEIIAYIRENGGIYSDWYVGIAADPRDRLFNNHGVMEKGGSWIYCPCETSNDARSVEKYFLDRLNAKGGSGGGDYTTKSVYAYRITSYTIQSA